MELFLSLSKLDTMRVMPDIMPVVWYTMGSIPNPMPIIWYTMRLIPDSMSVVWYTVRVDETSIQTEGNSWRQGIHVLFVEWA